LLATALFVPGCTKAPSPSSLPPPVVLIAEVTASNVPVVIEYIGQLDSPQNVEVRARVEAFVEKVLFTEGATVNQGDPLYLLDTKPFFERLEAAKGGLAEAWAALNKYEKDVARLRPLAEKRAIPQQDLDNAIASVEVGRANVQTAEARLKSSELDLSYCDVRAPASGRIGAKEVSVGELVGKGQPTLLATISQLDPIWFYGNISEVDFLRGLEVERRFGLRFIDVPLTLILADGSEHAEPGRWVFADRAVDTTTGTLRARAVFPNPGGALRPGMFGRVRMVLRIDRPSILVPQRAVQELQGEHFVWVVDNANTATQRPVKAGVRAGSAWVIDEGLQAGERIIVEGAQKARQGAPVHPMTAEEMAQAAAERQAGAQKPAGKE
jgi:membrane fusion protein (multidrug efflux system)